MINRILHFSAKNCPTSWVVVKWLLTDKALNKMMRKYLEKNSYPCYYDFLMDYELEGILTPDDQLFDAAGINFDEIDDMFESIKRILHL